MLLRKQMNKKNWKDRLDSLIKTRAVAKFNNEKSENDMEELDLMISIIKDKIKTFK